MKTRVWERKVVSLVLRDSVLGTGPKAYKEGRVIGRNCRLHLVLTNLDGTETSS